LSNPGKQGRPQVEEEAPEVVVVGGRIFEPEDEQVLRKYDGVQVKQTLLKI
jgi:hypothetical protein